MFGFFKEDRSEITQETREDWCLGEGLGTKLRGIVDDVRNEIRELDGNVWVPKF